MHPLTAWEWLECYGAINADPEKVHGDWDTARAEIREKINEAVSEALLEKLLKDTKPMAIHAAGKMICCGSTFGKLENLRREKAGEPQMCPHLDFGEIGENEAIWAGLLHHGTLEIKENKEAEKPPRSWMFQREWTEIIEKSTDCHEKYLHLAAIYIGERRLRDAGEAIEKALTYRETATALFILSQCHRLSGNGELAADTALRAATLLPDDISLVRRAFEMGYRAGRYDAIVSFYNTAPDSTRADGRISMYYAFALLKLGNIADAKAVLYRDGGLAVTDIQEGEVSITNLYIEIEKATAKKEGREISENEINIPTQFDFRMFVPKK
jgi:tetratricopeptide (TPR) repeat protein